MGGICSMPKKIQNYENILVKESEGNVTCESETLGFCTSIIILCSKDQQRTQCFGVRWWGYLPWWVS